MRRLCLKFTFLLAALVVAPSANAQGGLNLNQTYRDVIRLHFPAGKTQIPLPEGEWELLGLQEDQTRGLVTRIWLVYLARIENDTLVGQISIKVNHDLTSGYWLPVEYCDRDNHWFKEVKSNRDNDVDCWIVRRVHIKPENWKGGRKQMLDNLLSRNVNVTIPQSMIRADFYRVNRDNFLRITYYFYSFPLGRPVIARDDIKTWGRKWKPKVDAGFLGKLEAFKTKEKSALPKQSPKAAPPAYKKVRLSAFDGEWKGVMRCRSCDGCLGPLKKSVTIKVVNGKFDLVPDTTYMGEGTIDNHGNMRIRWKPEGYAWGTQSRRTFSFNGKYKENSFELRGERGPRSCSITFSRVNPS